MEDFQQKHANSVIIEELVESSMSNIEMSKSEESLKRPL
jgi:hypothetical protein